MQVRRIVTGHSPSGKSVFISDDALPRYSEFKHVPGMSAGLGWETSPNAQVPATSADPTETAASWVPQAGGTNVMVVTLPPDSVMASPDFDPAAAGGEYMQVLPGLAERFEMENPGMHTTDSVDYAMLLEGELHLELDDGSMKALKVHDLVVQNGTRHAWRNRSDRPATILFVLIGAKRNG